MLQLAETFRIGQLQSLTFNQSWLMNKPGFRSRRYTLIAFVKNTLMINILNCHA